MTQTDRPQTKTEKFLELFRKKMYKEALKIVHTFRLGFTKEEKEIIKIAHEMETGNASFYESLGYDRKVVFDQAIAILDKQYHTQL